MNSKVKFEYDESGDIMRIEVVRPNSGQIPVEISNSIFARLNPETRSVECIEIPDFAQRVMEGESVLSLPGVAMFLDGG